MPLAGDPSRQSTYVHLYNPRTGSSCGRVGHTGLDVFGLRDRLVDDYEQFTRSFISFRDDRIRATVDAELDGGLLWPEPLVQLNPSFAAGDSIDELVANGTLHEGCSAIFRSGKTEGQAGRATGKPLRLYAHQTHAIRTANAGSNYVLTTGTGSGKSLTYIVPIVDRVLREGSGKGIRAIVVYPMNALANSQAGELEKFLRHGFPDGHGPVTFRRYTGQEKEDARQEIIAKPPDILLTNYVMLELLLTRPFEKGLIAAARGLRFLVLDELHTYRGRQGADVALLVRRVREATGTVALQVVGTSATLAGAGTLAEQQTEIAAVASTMFGTRVEPEHVIGETLVRATEATRTDDAWLTKLRQRAADPTSAPEPGRITSDPVASWIESTLGLREEPATGRLIRARPRTVAGIDGAANDLAKLTGVDVQTCARSIAATLAAAGTPSVGGSRPTLPLKLHQFFSRGDTVFASIAPEDQRYLTTLGQQFVPGDRERILLPLAFCRECGQDYYTVGRRRDLSGSLAYEPREVSDVTAAEDRDRGFLYLGSDDPWPGGGSEELERVPESWREEMPDGSPRIKSDRKKDIPSIVHVATDGVERPTGIALAYVPAPFKFCLRCGVEYGGRQTRDLGKLGTLGAGGRSSATTLLSLTTIRQLRTEETLDPEARKLLAFSDNRQDVSLQAGHFNDFVEVGVLRSALYRATVAAGEAGLTHDQLTSKVTDELALPAALYAREPEAKFAAKAAREAALRDVVGYRLYRDLERGWRITSPNLEQAGLLDIRYESLDELATADSEWASAHPALYAATPEQRFLVGKTLLDHLRRELAVHVDYLRESYQDALKRRSNEQLILPWAIDESESLVHAAIAYPRGRKRGGFEYGGNVYLSPLGGLGLYLRRPGVLAPGKAKLTVADAERIIRELCELLRLAGLVMVVEEATEPGTVPGYQLASAAMRWHAGDGSKAFHDPIRVPNVPDVGLKANPYFVDFYKEVARDGTGIQAREHTAQVPNTIREEREEAFRHARLAILYCSPTMELGVDIADLNVVGMRNVPPTPANYAQRSGRAGRNGQPALIFTYASAGSPHDAYFFRRPELMVSGQVRPPRLDLTNEDLVRSHVQAMWLREVDKSLGRSLADILDLAGEPPSLALLPEFADAISSDTAKARTKMAAGRLLGSMDALAEADWYTERWLNDALDAATLRFDRACDRWRELYRAALEMRSTQNKVIGDASRSTDDRDKARRLRAEAESQLELLRGESDDGTMQSDFYSYRYFASEGFLPGYSFPRLPLSAWIPGRTGPAKRDDYLSRPRFLAISEFGPRSIVYHEGSRYVINRVLLPAARTEDNRLPLGRAKRCAACGYLHQVSGDGAGLDLCRRCEAPLNGQFDRLFRLANVSTRRRDRINSDEEERQRQGFEVISAVAFAGPPEHPTVHRTEATLDNQSILRLEFGPAATIWRINVGWRRRKRLDQQGFVLDTERGYWQKNDLDPDDSDDPLSGRIERVIPYVEDRRNLLLLQPTDALAIGQMASLAAALKSALQVEFQLEDGELAAEALPSDADRRVILLYESAEGGAGVLRRLVKEPDALRRVARAALELCHFDPDSGGDRGQAPRARERCEAACYDCLLSYGNQRDHRLLDRQSIKNVLLGLARAEVEPGSTPDTPAEHLHQLLALAGSGLERRWLHFVHERGYALPSSAQRLLEEFAARPDFMYGTDTVVFIDGPVHEYPNITQRDVKVRKALDDRGYLVIAFELDEDTWPAVLAKYPSVFGQPANGS